MGVDIDPSGRYQQAAGVDLAAARSRLAADRRDDAAVDGNIAEAGGAPVPSTMLAFLITVSCIVDLPGFRLCASRGRPRGNFPVAYHMEPGLGTPKSVRFAPGCSIFGPAPVNTRKPACVLPSTSHEKEA